MLKRNETAAILRALCALGTILLPHAEPAYAHKLKLFASAEGRTISGYAYFSGGARPRNQTVSVFSPTGDKLAETETNDRGEFAFVATCRCDHLLRIALPDGHAAGFVVKAHELPDDLPTLAPSTAVPAQTSPDAPDSERTGQPASSSETEKVVASTVAKQIRPMREQLDRLEERIRFRDVIGGVGYIFGVTGVAFYFLAMRKAQKNKPSAKSARSPDERSPQPEQ